ncbi:hypothetical protein K458DRAFT_396776 [Lentithecium fluviatile CBS 122367]|uniref:Uncharacterized protein n=1 Tax=Lentithecium fluviatile CBS 122367 TaxID=1168545 RepID=A0A6G1IEQ8_9PLEO|nr:hypothetical protein K458DRAFT_396776 [Lentithecium fluviatile CBS 122367]
MVIFDGHIVANQLQNVCRQFRKDTRGIVTRFSTIEFTPVVLEDTMPQIERLLRDCPSHHRRHIRRLSVRTREIYSWRCPWGFYDFMQKHPDITIELHAVPNRLNPST